MTNDMTTDKAWSLIKATWIGLDSFPVSEWREKVWNDLFPMLRDTCDEIRDSDGLVFQPPSEDVKLTRETMLINNDFDYYDFNYGYEYEGIRFYISGWSPFYWFARLPERLSIEKPIGNFRIRELTHD